MKKIDYKKELKQLKHLYKPSPKTVEIVDVPEMNFLMIDGQGDPNTSKEYRDAIEALWWVDDMSQFSTDDAPWSIFRRNGLAMLEFPVEAAPRPIPELSRHVGVLASFPIRL